MRLAIPKQLIIKAVTVIDDNNVIYKSNNNRNQKTVLLRPGSNNALNSITYCIGDYCSASLICPY